MSHDMDVRSAATIRLKAAQFDLMFTVLGLKTDPDRADLIGVSTRTVSRARDGVVGEAFMAKTVHALRQHRPELQRYGLFPSLDELFEVTATDPEAKQ